jgi:ribosomal protein S18 acetylase RimI-like enzyme
VAALPGSSRSTRRADVAEQPILVARVDFADRADLAQYLDLLDAYARDPMGSGQPLPEEVRARLGTDLPQHPAVYGLLARHGSTAVGFATCFLGYSTFLARPLLNIHDIAVLPEWRGQAVARQLLEAIEDLSHRLECCRITLEVREDNPRARSVYESAGFVPAQCSLFLEKPLPRPGPDP